MPLDPAKAQNDNAFLSFARQCEQAVTKFGDSIAARDAVADHASQLADTWLMRDPVFRALQPGAPYSSYQLYLNHAKTVSIIMDIFSPGQVAPIHNHGCWGVFVCLEGEEIERQYSVPEDLSAPPIESSVVTNGPGGISVAAPARNAFHQVECVGDTPAISLHIYGADLKQLERDRWDAATQTYVRFSSGGDPRRKQTQHYLTPEGLAQI